MKEKLYLSQTRFADYLKTSRQHITNLKKAGKLILNEKGLVDVEETQKLLKKMSDPAKAKKNFDIPKEVKGNLSDEEIKDILKNEDPSDYNQSKARKEYFLSKIAEQNFLKESSKLIEAEKVSFQYFTIAKLLRDKIFNIKMRTSSQLSILTNPIDISNLLDKEFREVFSSLDNDIELMLKETEEDEE